MKVLVDTPVWSYALRKHNPEYQHLVSLLVNLIKDQRVLIIGPIRQEILSGYSDLRKFKILREKLSFFENTPIEDIDYEKAAELHNHCRKKGIQGSHTDFLICAVANRINASVLTTDKDFLHFQKAIPLNIYKDPVISAHPAEASL
ncbi:MAG TPA: PIN domain-containing protein [Desulfobacteraceae bacterium]|nr:PIN domain-containing protein [Deltaproteobacteria bacterium]HDI60253.1 PIN domain-containing protein [Desulfobacteraceae bacterium]